MATEIGPRDIQEQVQYGFDRFKNFRNARITFLRAYTGAYYDRDKGEVGSEALNLIFNAIRILVPHIVMSFPQHTVTTQYLQYKQYADLLSLALDNHDKQISIRDVYRRVIVDAVFTLGIMKTGLAQSDSVYALDDQDRIDAGTIYTEAVDFDNFVVDPKSKEHMFRDASFMGDRIVVPRQILLDSGLYANDLVERLPSLSDSLNRSDRAQELSQRAIKADEIYDAEDFVEIVELWVPSANALITVPGSKDTKFDDYLRIDDYYGPKEGPYSLLALTPPVPGNPLPIPAVGVWYDLHTLANRMAKKIIEQAERQKDLVAYKRSAADDAEEAKNAADGEAVAMDDPDGIKTLSFGGQQNSNENHLESLHQWFNMMSANPEQLGGQQINAKTATSATILSQNASVGLEDMKDMVYQCAVSESRKRAWYLHTDPLINIPLTRRQPIPAQYAMGMNGIQMTAPPQIQEQQVVLTPEARRGDFIDFIFEIEPESMGRVDSKVRFGQAMDFASKIMPSVMSSAQIAMALGLPFSAKAFILRMAKDAGIDWMDEVFYDPEFQMQMMQMLAMGPQAQGSKGQLAPQQPNNMAGQIMQNGQPSNIPNNPNPMQQQHADQQAGAQLGQRVIQRDVFHGLTGPDALASTNY